MCASRQRPSSCAPYQRRGAAHELKGQSAVLVGVACSDLKLSKALVGFVIILGDERGVFKHPPLH